MAKESGLTLSLHLLQSPTPLLILPACFPLLQATAILRAATQEPIKTTTTMTTGSGQPQSSTERQASSASRPL